MYESSSPFELLLREPMPSARPTRESRVSGVLCDLVAIELHELFCGEGDSDGEGKGVGGGAKQCRLSGRVIGVVRVGQGR